MVVLAFLGSLVICSFILSAMESGTGNESSCAKPDYHFVPYAGDVFGA